MSAVVYRMYDASGSLLYIGSTANLAKRLVVHFEARLSRVASIAGVDELRRRFSHLTTEAFADITAARDAERDAIRDEAPELNRHYNTSRWRWTGREFVPAASP